LIKSIKTVCIDGAYELNQIWYVNLLKVTQHTTFVYVISWNSDKIVDSIYVMCWTALIAESIEKRCQDFYMKVSLSSLIENYNCFLFDQNILIWTELCFKTILRCFKVFIWTFLFSSVWKELTNYCMCL